MTQHEVAVLRGLELAVTQAVEEFRTSHAREVEVSNEIHQAMQRLLERHDERLQVLEKQMARLLGAAALAGFVIGIVGWQIWKAVVNP